MNSALLSGVSYLSSSLSGLTTGLSSSVLSALAAAPHAEESQLLDIDGTAFVMLGLFLVLLAVLTPVLWRPYIRIRAERSTRVDGYRAQAERMTADAEARLAKVDQELIAARREGAGALAVARAEAQAREQTLLAEAHGKAQRALAEAKVKLEEALAAQRANLQERAKALGKDAAARILGRSVS